MEPDNGGRKLHRNVSKYLSIDSSFLLSLNLHVCNTFNIVRPTRSPRQQWPSRRTKNGELSFVFSVQGTGGGPTGPDPEKMVGDQGIGNPVGPISSWLQVSCEPGQSFARTRHPGELSAAFFLQNILQLHQQRWVILRADILPLWKIIIEEDAV